jgi:hypothetical protein
MTDDIVSGYGMWEDSKNQHGIITARVVCLRYLDMQKNKTNPEEQEFCRELREAMAIEKNLKAVEVYRQSYDYAKEKGEETLFETSDNINIYCAGAIEEAIEACRYQGGGLKPEPGVQALIEHFGSERLCYVLAIEILRSSKDFSAENREWAQSFDIQNNFAGSGIRTHINVLDEFITCLRETMDKTIGAEVMESSQKETEEKYMDDKSIRFIDSGYKELFRIPDGGEIKISYPPGDDRGTVTRTCNFIDEMHVKVGNNDYHVCEFAERMEQIGAKYEPVVQLENAEPVPFTEGEEKFLTYNREENNTCIGHLAGSFGSQGNYISYSWSDRDNDRNTPEFKSELHSAVYALRQSVLKDHEAMKEFCTNHPEAKLPDRGNLEHYGFKLETESRQYFVLCDVENRVQDSRFIIYAYDNAAPVLEKVSEPQVTIIPTEAMNARIVEVLEPQAYAEKLLVRLCVEGLGVYAAQEAQFGNNSTKIKDIRDLVEQLVCYFGLDDGDDAKSLNSFLWDFDGQIDTAKSNTESIFADEFTARNVIYGLYHYGNDMVTSQGEIAMSDILGISEQMKKIAKAWDFDSEVLGKLTAKLEAEVQNMLDNYPTPGQPLAGLVNAGYEIKQAVMYNNDEGFALAHNPKAVQPFVTWEFRSDNGSFDCFWGNYFGTERDAHIDYIERTIQHTNLNSKATEKPLPDIVLKEKPSVMEKIKAAQKTSKSPKQTKEPKPEQGKKKTEPEL